MILGITGSFGSGKSTVARIFKSLSGTKAILIDADLIARRVMAPGTKIYRRVIAIFGSDILKKDGRIDRLRLARIVFEDKGLLKKLTEVVHPEVITVIKGKIKANTSRTVILDAPLLIEAGLGKYLDKLCVVRIKRERQIQRLIEKRGFARSDILKRINSQMPLGKKIRLADFVIDNNGDIRKTKRQAAKIWRLLWKN